MTTVGRYFSAPFRGSGLGLGLGLTLADLRNGGPESFFGLGSSVARPERRELTAWIDAKSSDYKRMKANSPCTQARQPAPD